MADPPASDNSRIVGAGPARERPAKPAGRIPEVLFMLSLEMSLASCRELRSLSRAGPAPASRYRM